MSHLFTRFLVEAERESEQDLFSLIEALSSGTSLMTRYQELAALLEVSTILANMSSQKVDEVFRKLSSLSKTEFREAYRIIASSEWTPANGLIEIWFRWSSPGGPQSFEPTSYTRLQDFLDCAAKL